MAFVMASPAGPRYPGPHEAGGKRKFQPGGSCLDENFLMGYSSWKGFPFQPSHEPSGKSGWGKTKALCVEEKHITVVKTGGTHVTLTHSF